jgi:DNA-binding GntR family transcriptional regulator
MQNPTIPLFVQVAETIRARIANHAYRPGDEIPAARELEKEFGVSNITIRRAIELLVRDGCILPRRGQRARVGEPGNDIVEIEIAGDFKAWVDMAVGRKLGIIAEIIDREEIPCPGPIRDILKIGPEENVERIKRVRKLKGTPISYYVNFGPSRLFKKLSSREIEKRSFIETFQKACSIRLKSMEQRVRSTCADMDLADILQVRFGFPLFFVRNVYYSENKTPMAVTHMYYRSDRYVYTIRKNL